MTRYIAVPRQDVALASLSLAEVGFSPDARKRQVETLTERRQQVAARAARPSLLEAARTAGVRSLGAAEEAPKLDTLPLTGIAVLEGEPEQLGEMERALAGYELIEDVPLTLVKPVKTDIAVTAASDVDTWHLAATQVTTARSSGFTGRGAGVGVAILDTGVEEVPEIAGRIASAFELDPATGRAVAIDTRDTEGHGTHVAGLVAGETVGVAPEAELMNFIMIPGGFGNLSDFVFAIEFVAQRPEISVLNMSAGIRGFNAGMKQAVSTALAVGILPVIAIGNEGANTSRSPGNYTEVVSVGASTKSNTVANFSGGGTMVVDNQSYVIPDVVAPGQQVTSCVMGGGYEAWNGTSMATPVVSGLAALIIEQNPAITEPDLRGEIMAALRLLPGIPPQRQGDGLAQLPPYLWFRGA